MRFINPAVVKTNGFQARDRNCIRVFAYCPARPYRARRARSRTRSTDTFVERKSGSVAEKEKEGEKQEQKGNHGNVRHKRVFAFIRLTRYAYRANLLDARQISVRASFARAYLENKREKDAERKRRRSVGQLAGAMGEGKNKYMDARVRAKRDAIEKKR